MMRIRCQYNQYYDEKLLRVLEENDIQYEIWGDDVKMRRMIKFIVYEGTKKYDAIDACVEHDSLNPLRSIEYTEEERQSASLLTIRPIRQCIDVINAESAFEYSCVYTDEYGLTRYPHCKQVGVLQIRKEPKLKKYTAFYSIDIGFSPIFADAHIQDLAHKHSLQGIEFAPVLRKNGSVSDVIYQVYSKQLIRREDILTGNGEWLITCPFCKQMQYGIDMTYHLALNVGVDRLQSDFYMTESIFGEGQAEPLYLISQRFYRLLKHSQLTRGIAVEPVDIGK